MSDQQDDDRPVRQIFHRPASSPTPPYVIDNNAEPKPDEISTNKAPSKTFRFLTWGVMLFAAAWLLVTLTTHIVPSKLTYTSQLVLLVFFAGEYVGWKGPRHK
jgi:hypothetical protein